MLAPKSYRPSILVFGSLFLLLLLQAWLVTPWLEANDPGISPDRPLLRKVQAKCNRAHRDDLAIITGTSSAVDGFLLQPLSAASRFQWMNLARRGGSYRALELHLEPLLVNGPKAELIVVGLHPIVLSSPPPRPPHHSARDLSHWALVRGAMHLQGRGFAAEIQADPFAETAEMNGAPKRFPKMVQMDGWEELHRFEPDSYSRSSSEYRSLRRLLTKLRGQGDRLVTLEMPESTALRQRTPSVARKLLRELTDSHAHFDLSAVLDDAQMVDHVHANLSGRQQLSELLLEKLFDLDPANKK